MKWILLAFVVGVVCGICGTLIAAMRWAHEYEREAARWPKE